jgi:hypothetical protein
LDQWLKQVYDEEVLVKEGQDLEAAFEQMDPADLLDVACGNTTIEKVAGQTPMLRQKPVTAPQPEPVKQASAAPQPERIGATTKVKLAFMDTVARQIARQHHDVGQVKQAQLEGEEMEKEDAFTTPEAQGKAKMMTGAMKAARGASAPERKRMIARVGKKL